MKHFGFLSIILAFFGAALAQDTKPGYVIDEDTGITLPEGFDAEILYDIRKLQGSWVAMAFDPRGRLIVSDQCSIGSRWRLRKEAPFVEK